MDNLKYLERYINSLGWYGGTSNLTISVTGEFEGYSGHATETWEYQTVIELKEVKGDGGKILCPYIKVVGRSHDGINDVAGRVKTILNDWKIEEFHKLTA